MNDRDAVILIEDVTVKYRVPVEPVASLKEYAIRSFQRRLRYREHLALKNVSLSVSRGESIGIVGHNGAGKSTLLKVVGRILHPTSGRVRVKGRVVPLMDIGAGFHPELTGKENAYLYAAMLGHRRQEIGKRLGQIFEFAEVDAFINAPLRTYSSGMTARLGFAVATAWEADVLIIDELLVAGDEKFQEKCAARLDDFRQKGATVLLVMHNSRIIKETCTRALWLDHGEAKACGPSAEVVSKYLDHFALGHPS